jgi:hypothetical protein
MLPIWQKNCTTIHLIVSNKGENVIKLTKEAALANLYLMKIHLLIIKLFIIKEISSWMVKILRSS